MYLYINRLLCFVHFFFPSGMSILFTKPENKAPDLFSFLFPFSTDVWLLVITAYVGMSLLFFIMARSENFTFVVKIRITHISLIVYLAGYLVFFFLNINIQYAYLSFVFFFFHFTQPSACSRLLINLNLSNQSKSKLRVGNL